MANIRAGSTLLALGIFILVFGGIVFSTCASTSPANGGGSGCEDSGAWLIALGVLLLVLGTVLLVVSFGRRTRMIQQVPDPSVPPPLIQPVVVQQTVEREVVKVRCPFCGNLCEVTAKACPSCGAPIG